MSTANFTSWQDVHGAALFGYYVSHITVDIMKVSDYLNTKV